MLSYGCVLVAVLPAGCSNDKPNSGVPMVPAAQWGAGSPANPATGGVGGTAVIAPTGNAGTLAGGRAPMVTANAGAAPGFAGSGGLAAMGGSAGALGASGATAPIAGSAGALAAGNGAAGGSAAGNGAAGSAGASGDPELCPGTLMPPAGGEQEYTLKSANGLTYSYILRVPKTVDSTRRAPLLFHWHALSSDPEEARSLTNVDEVVEAAKMIVVYPRSPDKSWDTGSCCTSTVGGKSRDEEVFARELVKDVLSKVCVDEKRIYTNGFSNGGMISQLLACRMANVFAAAGPMGSTLTIDAATCKPSRPMPLFMINGTADPLVGYNQASFSGGLTVPEDIKFWVEKNKCTGEPEQYLQKGKVTCKRYTQCAGGAEISFCAIEGMGHCIPGMKEESPSNCLTKSIIPLGMPNHDIDASQMNVEFLLRFKLE